MTKLTDYLATLRLWTLLGCVLAVASIVVLFTIGVGPAIFWALIATFALKLGDRE